MCGVGQGVRHSWNTRAESPAPCRAYTRWIKCRSVVLCQHHLITYLVNTADPYAYNCVPLRLIDVEHWVLISKLLPVRRRKSSFAAVAVFAAVARRPSGTELALETSFLPRRRLDARRLLSSGSHPRHDIDGAESLRSGLESEPSRANFRHLPHSLKRTTEEFSKKTLSLPSSVPPTVTKQLL